MVAPLEQAIREHLRQYVEGLASLVEFDSWFIQATTEVDRSGSSRGN